MLFLPLLAAITVIEPRADAKLLGWSADGHYLVWTEVETESTMPEYDENNPGPPGDVTLDESVTLAVVLDIRKNDKRLYVLTWKAHSPKGKKLETLKRKYSKTNSAADFEAWKKQTPLTLTANRKGKAGTANIAVKLDDPSDGTGSVGGWKGSSMSWTVGSGAKATFATTCGKTTNSELVEQEMGAMYTPTWKATPYWDPSGHHVLFHLDEAVAKTMRGPDGGRQRFVILPCGLRVSVVSSADATVRDKVADVLEKAGYTISDIGPAKAKRAATVIYADAAHTAEAEKLAKLVPGGATVDKLTWKPKADIVVAVGDSAK